MCSLVTVGSETWLARIVRVVMTMKDTLACRTCATGTTGRYGMAKPSAFSPEIQRLQPTSYTPHLNHIMRMCHALMRYPALLKDGHGQGEQH